MQVVLIRHVTTGAQVIVGTNLAAPPHSGDAVLLARITHNVGMADTDGRIIENTQVEGALIAIAIVSPAAGVPLHDDRFVGRGHGAWLSDLHHRANMAFSAVLVAPLPVGTTHDTGTYSHRNAGNFHFFEALFFLLLLALLVPF